MNKATSRRHLLRTALRLAMGERDDVQDDYFDSYESAYPLLNAAGEELLREEAQRHGIDTTGKSDLEVAREIFARHVHPRHEVSRGNKND